MKDRIEKFLKDRNELKSDFVEYCQDESIPLDERWDLFVKSGLGDFCNYVSGCQIIDEIIDKNEIAFEKYSTNHYADILNNTDFNDKEEYDLSENWKEEIKKYALMYFEAGWIHDW